MDILHLELTEIPRLFHFFSFPHSLVPTHLTINYFSLSMKYISAEQAVYNIKEQLRD